VTIATESQSRCSLEASLVVPVVRSAPAPASELPPAGLLARATDGGRPPESSPATAQVVSVPRTKVRFLQAMAEDGPQARHCRIAGFPAQQVVQDTLC
jgi:hypothetical protein